MREPIRCNSRLVCQATKYDEDFKMKYIKLLRIVSINSSLWNTCMTRHVTYTTWVKEATIRMDFAVYGMNCGYK